MDLIYQDVSLYVHIPFCIQRCSYCDFYFVTTKHGHDEFVDALCLEITQVSRKFPDISLSTVYFGGGTPSRLSPCAITRILSHIHACFDAKLTCEITLEANPEDVTAAGLEKLKYAGITRISLGVQSFRDEELHFMNRCHNSEQAAQACKLINDAEFDRWSLDLIFGVPGASTQEWQENLHRAVETGATHISTYSLTVEPHTPLHKQVTRGMIKPASGNQIAEQFQIAIEFLESIGFEHYEVSSFAHPNHRSRHNMRYWTHTNYLGVGPSAHSFWWQDGRAVRWENIRSLRSYNETVIKGESPANSRETLSDDTLVREKIMLALRTSEGLDLEHLRKNYGFDLLKHKQTELKEMRFQGLLVQEGASIRLTKKGMHVCDRLTTKLWPD